MAVALDMKLTASARSGTDILLDGGENVDLFDATVGQSRSARLRAGVQRADQQLHRGIWPRQRLAW